MIYVQKKDRERFEAMLRRFNRQVMYSRILNMAKDNAFYKKKMTRQARRKVAIRSYKINEQMKRELV